jgi:hypothetical protein
MTVPSVKHSTLDTECRPVLPPATNASFEIECRWDNLGAYGVHAKLNSTNKYLKAGWQLKQFQ